MIVCYFFFFKQKTAYEMRISDWSSDVCSSDLRIWRQAEAGIVRISPDLEVLGKIVIGIAIAIRPDHPDFFGADAVAQLRQDAKLIADPVYPPIVINDATAPSRWNHLIDRNILQWHEARSEEHTSELQSLMRTSYAVFCLKKKKKPTPTKMLTHQRNKKT